MKWIPILIGAALAIVLVVALTTYNAAPPPPPGPFIQSQPESPAPRAALRAFRQLDKEVNRHNKRKRLTNTNLLGT